MRGQLTKRISELLMDVERDNSQQNSPLITVEGKNVPESYGQGDHHVELAYITPEEARILADMDIYDSDPPHPGPGGIRNFNDSGNGGGGGGGGDGPDGDADADGVAGGTTGDDGPSGGATGVGGASGPGSGASSAGGDIGDPEGTGAGTGGPEGGVADPDAGEDPGGIDAAEAQAAAVSAQAAASDPASDAAAIAQAQANIALDDAIGIAAENAAQAQTDAGTNVANAIADSIADSIANAAVAPAATTAPAPGTPGEAAPGADVDVDVVDQTQEGSTDTGVASPSDADIGAAIAIAQAQSQADEEATQAVLDAIQGQVALGANLSQVEEAQLGTIANLNLDRASRPSSRPSLSQTAFSSLPDNVQANVQSVLGNTTNLSDEDAEAIDAAQQTANQGEANAVAIAIDAIGVPQNVQEEQLLEQLQQQPLSVQPDPNTVQQQENQDIISILAETNQITEAQALDALSQNISQGGVGVGSPGGFAAAGFSEITPTVAQVVALNQGSANPTIGFALNDPQGTSVGSRSASDAFAAINPSLTNAVFGIASALGPGAIGAVAGLAGLNENRGLAQLALSNLPESVQNAISTNVTSPISDLFGTISQNIGLSPSATDIAVAQGENFGFSPSDPTGVGGDVGAVGGDVGGDVGAVGGDPPPPQVTPPPTQLTPALPPTPQLPNTLDALSLLPALTQNAPRQQQTASPFAASPFAPVNLPPAFTEEDARRLLLSTGQLPLAGIV